MSAVRDLKIALVGVSHWHAPLYLPGIATSGARVVAVSDDDETMAGRFANRLGCRYYANADRLLDAEAPDFVFAFDVHSRMPALARNLIARKIGFSIEKPLGLNVADVTAVRDAARFADAFCAIPFVWRYSDLVRDFRQRVSPADIIHLAFRFVAGPPSRYKESSPWMLHKATAGGGCMTNLGVHFIDLALLLTASESAEVLAAAFHHATGYDVEDYASALLTLSSGASLALETGYAYPMDAASKRDNRWNIVSRTGYYSLEVGLFEAREYGRPTSLSDMDTDSDVYYGTFAAQTLEEFATGLAPTCGLDDMVRTRRVLDAIAAGASR